MRNVRGWLVLLVAASLTFSAMSGITAHAAGPVVTLTDTFADINTSQFVDNQHQKNSDKTADNFFAFGHHLAPPKISGLEGTASAFVLQASTMETPGQPPFPTGPLNDIALSGTATAAATATGNGAAVPVAFSEGTLDVQFETTAPVSAFFDGTLVTTNTTRVDECSNVTVELTGPGTFTRSFAAYTGDCEHATPHQKSFAETDTLPAGEWELRVDYESDVDAALPEQPHSVTASAKALVNLSFFPPNARFTTTLSGFTGHFNGSSSSAGASGNHVTRWKWTFGDGKAVTTTTPKVTHTYPSAPNRPPSYVVTLRVVDSGGSVSAPRRHTIVGTATSLTVKRTSTKINFSGVVKPARPGRRMLVTLAKRHGAFRHVATTHPKLSPHSHFAATFTRPTPGTCRIVARFGGDKTHLASQIVKTFAC